MRRRRPERQPDASSKSMRRSSTGCAARPALPSCRSSIVPRCRSSSPTARRPRSSKNGRRQQKWTPRSIPGTPASPIWSAGSTMRARPPILHSSARTRIMARPAGRARVRARQTREEAGLGRLLPAGNARFHCRLHQDLCREAGFPRGLLGRRRFPEHRSAICELWRRNSADRPRLDRPDTRAEILQSGAIDGSIVVQPYPRPDVDTPAAHAFRDAFQEEIQCSAPTCCGAANCTRPRGC